MKAFLLDQRRVAGVGNIYADEALFRARIHPLRPAGRLRRAGDRAAARGIVEALEAGIARQGASIDDYRDVQRRARARCRTSSSIHLREGEPCLRCGRPVVKLRAAGRGTYVCRRCQPAPRRARARPVSAAPEPLPDGFAVGHWTDREAATGCTVVLAPPDGAVASGDVRGGGPGTPRDRPARTRSPTRPGVHAVLLTGGSAFGLAAADGVMRWLERNGRGYATPGGLVPLVPAAVVYDLVSGDPTRAAGPGRGRGGLRGGDRASRSSAASAPARAPRSASCSAASRAVKSGVGLAAQHLPQGARLAALAVVNAFGDVIGEDGTVLAGPRGDDGELRRHDRACCARG